MKQLKNGLLTGMMLQLAIGPVFFFIMSLTIQKSIADGFAGVLAVTLVDYIYISLAIFGIGKLLEKKKIKKIFGIISSSALIIFGLWIVKGIVGVGASNAYASGAISILSSFSSVFLITITSPMTIVFFTSLFTAKAVEYNYTQKELLLFGLGTGFATLIFMSASVILFSFIRSTVPLILIIVLNGIVGCLLIGYGSLRLWKTIKKTK